MPLQVSGRGTGNEANTAQAPCKQSGIWKIAKTDNGIHSFLRQIDVTFAEFNIDQQIRVLVHQLSKYRKHNSSREPDRHMDAQSSARNGRCVCKPHLRSLDINENLPAALEELKAIIRQTDTSRRPVQQANAKIAFESQNSLAHR